MEARTESYDVLQHFGEVGGVGCGNAKDDGLAPHRHSLLTGRGSEKHAHPFEVLGEWMRGVAIGVECGEGVSREDDLSAYHHRVAATKNNHTDNNRA